MIGMLKISRRVLLGQTQFSSKVAHCAVGGQSGGKYGHIPAGIKDTKRSQLHSKEKHDSTIFSLAILIKTEVIKPADIANLTTHEANGMQCNNP
ncbi:hypothetical protein DPMN_186551 [Dreissena polymorpha]|uniref:Uncharacterized protein n=1 Tax=Dreissena polymorpha TaxID=45954 RepID=A0A9D4I9F8_DREPO|nr:hypothetical protein DPMN_186551 [Dreissena polymorpha]